MLLKTLRASPGALIRRGVDKYPELIAYLSFLKETSNLNVDELDLTRIEGIELVDGKLNILAVNKTAINRVVREAVPARAIDATISDNLKAALAKFASGPGNQHVERMKQQVADHQEEVQQSVRGFNRAIQSLTHATEQLALFEGRKFSYDDYLIKILQDGFWGSPVATNRGLNLTSNDDVWVKFNDPSAAVNKSYNAGKFVLKITLNNGLSMKAHHETENQIKFHEYPHPHVVNSGEICLGNANASFAEAAARLDIYEMAKIVQAVLTNYCPDNPYVSFDRFYNQFERIQARQLRSVNESYLREQYEKSITELSDEWSDDDLNF